MCDACNDGLHYPLEHRCKQCAYTYLIDENQNAEWVKFKIED